MGEIFSFGVWVRRRRKALDLTQDVLARRVGCALSMIRKIEADERKPSRQIAALLASALAVPAAEREQFLQAARAELAVDQLAAPPATAAPEPPLGTLPTGTVTFLFTDIEGSTTLWEQHPTAMQPALARHDGILRDAIAAHGGHVFNTAGDAFHAAFPVAADALDAVLAAQRALADEAWGSIGPIRVRAALHVGAAQQRDGDYYGPSLNRVARLCAAGHGGQILLSNAAQELARDALPKGAGLRDLGEHRLKDLARPERIFQIVVADLPADFPPLRTLDRYRHNLPAQPTALISREAEVAAVCVLLRKPEVRLLTLTGPGGTGKTRLGLQIAAELLDDFRDGVFFVPLAPITDPTLVISAIAATLGVKEAGGQPLLEMLTTALRDKPLLLLLDNFEQVLAAAARIAELLAAAPHLKVLVTSREMLHIYGEREYPVPTLSLPDMRRLPPIARLTQYAAVRLFIERAQAVRPDFAVTTANAPAVAEICTRLDGLPLAIELAAARIKLFPPQSLLARLDNRLKLLTGGARDLPARQQTIRNAIDWSYHLLDAGEKKLFTRLGVFVGGCTLEAAEAVCNVDGDLPMDVVDGIAALVDQSLARQNEEPNGEPRFVMLETIRAYALERLADGGELDTVRRQHLDYYLALAEQAGLELDGAQQRVWLARLRQDYDNLRAALGWIIEQDAAELGLRLARALEEFWFLAGYISEGVRWATALVAQARAAWPAELRAQALGIAGFMAWQQGDYAAARGPLEESAAIYRRLGDKRNLAGTLNLLGRTLLFQGEHAWGRAILEENTALSQEISDVSALAGSLQGRAYVAMDQADYRAARLFLEQCLSISQTSGDQWGIAQALNDLGDVARCEDDYAQATTLYQQSLTLFHAQGIHVEIAAVLHNLGYVALAQGDQQRARAHFAESLALHREQGNRPGMLECLAGFGALVAAQGQPRRATILFGAIAALRAALRAPMWPAERVEYERHLAGVRGALDDGAWQAARAEGGDMTLEEAIAYGLGEDD